MNKNRYIQQVESKQLRDDIPNFSQGDTVVVQVRVLKVPEKGFSPLKELL